MSSVHGGVHALLKQAAPSLVFVHCNSQRQAVQQTSSTSADVISAFFREMDNWRTRNPGKRVCDYDICDIFTPAFVRTANVEKAVDS